ncbi:DUF4254 domain-containing protein [Arenicella sp. 4NH20-0111]|uniref:DUF4254 domain-containing protein n=1 Tax=Arenicella sp. 4NH20-0111 TaxID=3127648 RepID=UPI003105A9BC
MISLSSFAEKTIELQTFYTNEWHTETPRILPADGLPKLIASQHEQNFDLWHEEDKARDPLASNATIAQVKRNIDAHNQCRNDLITEIDIWLAEHQLAEFQNEALPWNSETIGSIIDRLSIASLKVFHMLEQTERKDVTADHVTECKAKLARLTVQQQDLGTSMQHFMNEIVDGKKQNKLYRQFKMYNDPMLNPKIYSNKT